MLDRVTAAITGRDPNVVSIEISPTHGTVRSSTERTAVIGNDVVSTRRAALQRVLELAATRGEPVPVEATDPQGKTGLIVYPNGTVAEDPVRPRSRRGPLTIVAVSVIIAGLIVAFAVLPRLGDDVDAVSSGDVPPPTVPSVTAAPTVEPPGANKGDRRNGKNGRNSAKNGDGKNGKKGDRNNGGDRKKAGKRADRKNGGDGRNSAKGSRGTSPNASAIDDGRAAGNSTEGPRPSFPRFLLVRRHSTGPQPRYSDSLSGEGTAVRAATTSPGCRCRLERGRR